MKFECRRPINGQFLRFMKFIRGKLVQCLALALAALCLSGCSTRFNRQWSAPTVTTASQSLPKSLSGRWEGSWLSGKNGHRGKLRCIITPLENNEYEFYYWATYWKLFRASYKINAQATEVDGKSQISGERDLGRLFGGVYTHTGEAADSAISATYKCRIDHGTFELSKVR